jgi:hypothetical protein
MSEYNNDELLHYGIPGMKWGHRKNISIVNAKQAYKSASKDLRKAKVKRVFSKSTWIAGNKNVVDAKKQAANIKKLANKKEQAAFKLIDKQAKYAYDKKLSKTGNKDKAEKASMKVHMKAMNKGKGGLSGSISDAQSGGANTRYYKHMVATKGKKYAEKVEKKLGKKLMTDLGVSLTIAGASYVSLYLQLRDN